MKRKVIIAITGASGAIYAQNLIKELINKKEQIAEVGIVMSKNASTVWETELENDNYKRLPFKIHEPNNFNAPFASGSAQFDTMIIVPCSMGTLGRMATGISNDLITRAADVILKERRKLICVAREAPYNLIHIKNMETITLAGGIICPATPSFYHNPKTIDEIVDTVVHRVLDLAGLPVATKRWNS